MLVYVVKLNGWLDFTSKGVWFVTLLDARKVAR